MSVGVGVGVKMSDSAPPRAKKPKKVEYSLILLDLFSTFIFMEFNFETENDPLYVRDHTCMNRWNNGGPAKSGEPSRSMCCLVLLRTSQDVSSD